MEMSNSIRLKRMMDYPVSEKVPDSICVAFTTSTPLDTTTGLEAYIHRFTH